MKTKKMIGILALMVALLFIGCPPETEGTDVESLTLTSPQEYLAPGQTLTLSAAVVPETAAVTFESDNLGVATVDEKGVVKGVSEGTAIITASAGTKTDDVAVTVIPYTSISIKELESYTIGLGATLQLELEWEPASVTAPKNVKWVSSNPETFSVDEATGLVTSNSSTESAEIYAEIYSGALKTAAVTVRGEKAPAPMVENLRAFTGDSRYTIYWDAVEGATGYNLYLSTEDTKPETPDETIASGTTFYRVDNATNGEIINIWVEAIVADTIPLESPASTTVTVGSAEDPNDKTITIDNAQYTLDREVNFLEGTLAPSEYMGDREVEFSVDPESGVLTTKGGTKSTGDGYESETSGSGANSWLIWTPPTDVLPIEKYDYIEVELKTSGGQTGNGFWTVLNHNNDTISYELVHYNNNNGSSTAGWFISYGGAWRSNGKSVKLHSGRAINNLPAQGDYHQFGILFPEKTPSKIRLYADRTAPAYVSEDSYSNSVIEPAQWSTNTTTTFEFIFGANNCPNYQAEISKIRYYKASESATPSP